MNDTSFSVSFSVQWTFHRWIETEGASSRDFLSRPGGGLWASQGR